MLKKQFRLAHSLLTALHRQRQQWGRFFLLAGLMVVLSWLSHPQLNLLSGSMAAPALTANTLGASASASATDLLQQGETAYEAGQFAQAATLWKQAAETYQGQGDRLNGAKALSNLALAAQQLGQLPEANRAIAQSLSLLESLPMDRDRWQILAQVRNTQARLQLAQGQVDDALATMEQATTAYGQAGDSLGLLRSQINQAQILRSQGRDRRALDLLTQVNQSLQAQPNSSLKAIGLRHLGNTLRLVGSLSQSYTVLEESLTVADAIASPADSSAALLSLGNVTRAQGDAGTALTFYQRAAMTAVSPMTRVQALVNRFSLLVDAKLWPLASQLQPQIQTQISQLPLSRTAIYAQINVARSLNRLRQETSSEIMTPTAIANLIATAVQQSRQLGDQRAESYALGNLGSLYEQTQQWGAAQEVTQQALLLAQQSNAPDIAYQWQWQLGRLLNAQGNSSQAILAYGEAIKTLQGLRSDLVAVNPDAQFSFRDEVEPVYRQLVSLLLTASDQAADPQANLVEARNVLESLQLAELVNFFRANCVSGTLVPVDRIDPKATVIYPIILPDRLDVILSLPNQPLRHYATRLPQSDIENTLNQLLQTLSLPGDNTSRRDRQNRQAGFDRRGLPEEARQESEQNTLRFLPLAQQAYDWLIRPLEADLAKSQVKTLVFVLDGTLRNVPMAVLHDGQQYLMEKYAIALAPGLQLIDPEPLAKRSLRAVLAGLTEARQGFPELPFVGSEIKEIQSALKGKVLLNQAFNNQTLEATVKSASFPIVHLATHGQFSSNPDETFILTWNDRINVRQIGTILQANTQNRRGAIELLVLSACQTATGDNRAALGLAGVAVRAGARSTLATLWVVDDAGTSTLMAQFYRQLEQPNLNKAEALQRAQLSLLADKQFSHPYFWAPFVLVGSWL